MITARQLSTYCAAQNQKGPKIYPVQWPLYTSTLDARHTEQPQYMANADQHVDSARHHRPVSRSPCASCSESAPIPIRGHASVATPRPRSPSYSRSLDTAALLTFSSFFTCCVPVLPRLGNQRAGQEPRERQPHRIGDRSWRDHPPGARMNADIYEFDTQ